MAVLETDKTSSPYKLSHSIFMNVEILGFFFVIVLLFFFFCLNIVLLHIPVVPVILILPQEILTSERANYHHYIFICI